MGPLNFLRLVRPYSMQLAAAFAAMLLASATELLEPWPLKIIFDYVIGSKPPPAWLTAWPSIAASRLSLLDASAIAVIVIALLGAVSTFAQKYLATTVGQRVMHDLRHMLYHHVQCLSLSFFERRQTGDMVVRLTSDIDAAQDFISSILLGMVFDMLTLVGMLVAMVYLDWRFTLIALSVAPVLFVMVYRMTRRIKQATREVKRKESELASAVQESISSIRVVKAFGREEFEERRLDKESLESVDAALRARRVKSTLGPMVDIVVAIGTGLVLVIGVRLVLTEQLTAGSLLVFIAYLGKMYKPMKDLSKMTDTVSKATVSFERIGELMRTSAQVREAPDARPAPPFQGRIEFVGVRFSYTPDHPVLSGIDVVMEPGETVAIVGSTGGGKSTMVGLLPRFYDPTAGSVRIDGGDIRHYTLKSLRDQISLVLQHSVLFRGTVWQNIAYGKPDASHVEIVAAAKLAGVHEFIEQLPNGYDTIVGERGDTVSGGQRQLIAIARAIIRNAPILIFDEPSASLDGESEERVFAALSPLMAGKTSLIISHRISTIRRADRILVLENGVIVESGTHETLLARAGAYAQLHARQSVNKPVASGIIAL
jgi:subfamily B ATP-binding cassette protein MsbA